MRTPLTLRPPQPSPPPPCLFSSTFLFSFRPSKRFHFLTPCSSLKQTKKQKRSTAPTTAPQSLRWFFSNPRSEEEGGGGGAGGGGGGDKRGGDGEKGGGLELEGDTAIKGTILAGVLLVGVVGGFSTVGYVYKDQINAFLSQFSTFIEGNCVKISYLFEVFFQFGIGFC